MCQIQFDGAPSPSSVSPGDIGGDTSSVATNGFARTAVSDVLDKGRHTVALACEDLGAGDVRIDAPTIAAIAINEPR